MASKKDPRKDGTQTPIAIIGMGCMFPTARNLTEFWRSLRTGRDGIGPVPESHWRAEDYFDPDPKKPDMTYCARGGFLSAVPFDPTEFGIPPTILEATDTTQLLGLVAAKAALDDAGYGENRDFNRDAVSVVVGVTGTQELVLPLAARLGHPKWRKALADAGVAPEVAEDVVERIAESYVSWQENSFPGLLGNVVAGRIANRLNLRGTNCVVDAACASSLSAIHLAMLELTTGRCDMALAGGADTLNDIFMYMCFSKTPALSPTGDARPFSSDADGTVLGEGVGMLVLKRLEDAERDGDRIYAVLRSIGTSSDGRSQSIYAPHAAGQARALRDAYRLAGVGPETIELIEAHGTGTKVGDVTEFEALRTVFDESKRDGAWCAIGSVKSQIGHTKAAAGVAGLIKAALAIHHRALPPTIKVGEPNARMGIDGSPFYVSTELRPWISRAGRPRRAGVSAFGFGGSNFHAVLEEHEATLPAAAWDGSVQIIALSADTLDDLRAALEEWVDFAESDSFGTDVFAHRAWRSREAFSIRDAHRLTIMIDDGVEVAARLRAAAERLANTLSESTWTIDGVSYGCGMADGKLAFLFPGQGSQYVRMGRDLACTFPEMTATIAEAEDVSGQPIGELVYPRPVFDESERSRQASALTRTDIAQPALGAVSLGMSRVLERFGVRPAMTAGHSFGELVALCAAGRFDAATLHRLARLRGRLMAEGDGDRGAMLAVKASADDLQALISRERLDVIVANRNAPMQCVLSGERAEIGRAAEACRKLGYAATPLRVSGAFHSRLMDSAVAPFRNALEATAFMATDIETFANTTGGAYPATAAEARRMLGEQLVRPVDFVGEIEAMYAAGARVFVEVGPRGIATGLVREILADRPFTALSLDESAGRSFGVSDLARVLSRLAAMGFEVDLSHWEKPAAEPRIAKMVVPLSGANYRDPRKQRAAYIAEARTTSATVSASKPIDASQPHSAASRPIVEPSKSIAPAVAESGEVQSRPVATKSERSTIEDHAGSNMNSSDRNDVKPIQPEPGYHRPGQPTAVPTMPALQEAVRLVQQGLTAMQRLQQQTAEVHQKFIESQTEAHRTVQMILESHQRMVVAAMSPSTSAFPAGIVTAPLSSVPNDAPQARSAPIEAVRPSASLTSDMTAPATPAVSLPATAPIVADSTPSPATAATAASGGVDRTEIEHILVEVVCEKTGYPADMIDPSMDIEADLGVDSIKRVEIIAALEERIPSFGGVKPEYMGSIRTLAQIVDFVAADIGGISTEPRRAAGAASHVPTNVTSPTAAVASECRIDGTARQTESAAANSGTFDRAALGDTLLSVVAELTGYPRDMLELGMDMEADLGIDSIKRVEILAGVESRVKGLPAVKPEYMGSMRTLEQIVNYLVGEAVAHATQASTPAPTAEAAATPSQVLAPEQPAPVSAARADSSELVRRRVEMNRRVLGIVELPAAVDSPICIACDREILVTDDGADLSRRIVARLDAAGIRARLVAIDAADATAQSNVGGLLIVAPPRGAGDSLWRRESEDFVKSAFALMKSAAAALQSAASEGGGLFATIARMDGAFGLSGGEFDAAQGALAGLSKSAAREWPAVNCRAIDVALSWTDAASSSEAIVRELGQPGPIEVGLDPLRRRGLALSRSHEAAAAAPALHPGDVVIVTGGARGVTAEAALALAQRYQPTLVLLGRTALPDGEPAWLSDADSDDEVRKAVRANEFSGHKPTPKELKAAVARHLGRREIRRNLDRIAAACVAVRYISLDVCDAGAVREAIQEIESSHGPVRGIVHGAGVIEDRRIENKTAEQFAAVFDTKVAGLRNVLDAIDVASLRAVVMFSSVSGRCGNVGQADYAAANELLNKASHRLAARLPDARIVSLNWGPWDGGMVHPALRQEFVNHGLSLIPPEDGAELVADELADGGSGVEIVIGSDFESIGGADAGNGATTAHASMPVKSAVQMTMAFERRLDPASHPFLYSHVIDGRAVLPAAMMLEWLSHAAMHALPGLYMQGMSDFRVLKGVVIRDEPPLLRLYAGRPRRVAEAHELDVELRSAPMEPSHSPETLHARATITLASRLATAPPFTAPPELIDRAYERGAAGAYADVLFHGEMLVGIERVEGYSSAGMIVRVAPSGAPGEWMADPPRSCWLTSPLVVDAIFQTAILWTVEELGAPCLPAGVGQYRQFRAAFPPEAVSVVFEVRRRERHRCVADATVLARDGAVIARLEGVESTVDPSLAGAFRRRESAASGGSTVGR